MLNINLEDLLNIIDDVFSCEITAYSVETNLGVDTYVDGKKQFLEELKKELLKYANKSK